jgi:DNA-binding transcriptional ArsR family regulator
MLKGQDILVLLKLLDAPMSWTMRSLGRSLDLDPAGVHRALGRLEEARLVDADRERVDRSNAEELLVHGLRYFFPARRGGPVRGVPTAWASEPLRDELAENDEPPPVWPYPYGEVRGIALEPIHEKVPKLATSDPALWQPLALIDAIRLGDGRVRSLASTRLSELLHRASAPS